MTSIRGAEVGEADTLAALHVTTWQEAYSGLLPASYLASLTPSQRLPMWQDLLATQIQASILVADAAGEAIGCGGRSTADDAGRTTGEMWMIYLNCSAGGTGDTERGSGRKRDA